MESAYPSPTYTRSYLSTFLLNTEDALPLPNGHVYKGPSALWRHHSNDREWYYTTLMAAVEPPMARYTLPEVFALLAMDSSPNPATVAVLVALPANVALRLVRILANKGVRLGANTATIAVALLTAYESIGLSLTAHVHNAATLVAELDALFNSGANLAVTTELCEVLLPELAKVEGLAVGDIELFVKRSIGSLAKRVAARPGNQSRRTCAAIVKRLRAATQPQTQAGLHNVCGLAGVIIERGTTPEELETLTTVLEKNLSHDKVTIDSTADTELLIELYKNFGHVLDYAPDAYDEFFTLTQEQRSLCTALAGSYDGNVQDIPQIAKAMCE